MAIGFPPKYDTEINVSHLTPKRAHILVHESLGSLGWKIIDANGKTTIAHTNPNEGEYDELITITIEGEFLEFESKSVKNKFIDFGVNKKNFKAFETQYEETTLFYEGKDLVDLSHTYNQVDIEMPGEDFSDPDSDKETNF